MSIVISPAVGPSLVFIIFHHLEQTNAEFIALALLVVCKCEEGKIQREGETILRKLLRIIACYRIAGKFDGEFAYFKHLVKESLVS